MQKSSEWPSSKAAYCELSMGLYGFHIAYKHGYGGRLHPFPHTPCLWQTFFFFLSSRSESLNNLESIDIC